MAALRSRFECQFFQSVGGYEEPGGGFEFDPREWKLRKILRSSRNSIEYLLIDAAGRCVRYKKVRAPDVRFYPTLGGSCDERGVSSRRLAEIFEISTEVWDKSSIAIGMSLSDALSLLNRSHLAIPDWITALRGRRKPQSIPPHIEAAYVLYRSVLDNNQELESANQAKVYAAIKARAAGTGRTVPSRGSFFRYVRRARACLESSPPRGAD